jgi:hypothetical protein
VHQRLGPGRDVDADEREPVAPSAREEPEPVVVRRDERSRVGARAADPRARTALPVREPLEDIARVLGDQRGLPAVEAHPGDPGATPALGDEVHGRIIRAVDRRQEDVVVLITVRVVQVGDVPAVAGPRSGGRRAGSS